MFLNIFLQKKQKNLILKGCLHIFMVIYVEIRNKMPIFALNMETDNEKSIVYSHDVLEFVTVAVQYCALVEQDESLERRTFVDTILKLLPLLYIKGALIPKYEPLVSNIMLQEYVSEENYDIVRNNIAYIMGEQDDYLDVFVEDMKYSDSPILCTISENVADIYQDLKNFVCAMKDGMEDVMEEALYECKCNFENYWGIKVANIMRALHEVRYKMEDDDLEEEMQ